MRKIAIVIGTRPEIIKMAPVIRECQKRGIPFVLIHSGQHYDENLDKIFFKELELPEPNHNLTVGSAYHQLALIIEKLTPVLKLEKPDLVFVHGDTNTTLAASIVASRAGISLAHVEAGLRSYDRLMPEEPNRLIADQLADFLFCPTEVQREILINEDFDSKKIFVVGNTIVDSVKASVMLAKNRTNLFREYGIESGNFFLLTCHRQANTDYEEPLTEILNGVSLLAEKENVPCIFPVHPRLNSKLETISKFKNIKCIKPIGYLDFLFLQNHAKFIFTDSGGVQEESCILHKKCIILGTTTERPEVLTVGGTRILSRIHRDEIVSAYMDLKDNIVEWSCPFGDGHSARKIMDIILADN